MTLGEVIAQYRAENKVSLSAFAKKAGLSKSYLFYLESGKNPGSGKQLNPTMETTLACCKAMDMDILQFFEKLDPEIAAEAKESLQKQETAPHPQNHDTPPSHAASALTSNIPTTVPRGIPLTNETLTAAIKERRLLILPTRIPRRDDFVYLPMREYMMAVAFTVKEAGGGIFRAESEAGGSVLFTIFDLDKSVFTTRGGAAAVIRMWEAEAGLKL